jgi:hypothetical protein
MLTKKGWQQIIEVAKESKVIKKVGELIKKKPNSIHKPKETFSTIFKGFLQNIRIYHFQLKKAKPNISTYYRDIGRCDKNSYEKAKEIIERFYLKARRKRKIKVTLDGMFLGLRGKKFEKASKMYSGNKNDKGKAGYTIVTCFDSVNKLPMSFDVPLIHEVNAAPILIKKVLDWEKDNKITIQLFVLDALYFNKEVLNLISKHKFVMRTPAKNWLLKYIDKNVEKGCKEIELWEHKVLLCWRKTKENHDNYNLLIANTNSNRIWWRYGHYKQMIENYHDDLKNKLGIRKLPSHKFFAILVYYCIIILIYMLARFILLKIGMNRLSCGTLLFVVSISTSKESLIEYLSKLYKRKRIRRNSK